MLKSYLNKKNYQFLATFVVSGILLGLFLGYTVVLKYKSDGVLSLDMNVAEFRRFSEASANLSNVKQLLKIIPSEIEDYPLIETEIKNARWSVSVPRLSKADAKDLPDVLQELEADKNNPEKLITPYVGVRITSTAKTPHQAARVATWLGNYFKEIAAKEAIREQLFNWIAENRQFLEKSQTQQMKYAFDIEQAQVRSKAIKQVVQQYPEYAKSEARQVVDVRKDNGKFISPGAQLVGAETEIIDIREKLARLSREQVQQGVAQAFLTKAEKTYAASVTGSGVIQALREIFTSEMATLKTDAEKEKLLSFAADVSKISARYLSQAQFVVAPAVPQRPEQPRPLVLAALLGFLGGLAALLWIFKDAILESLRDKDGADGEPNHAAN